MAVIILCILWGNTGVAVLSCLLGVLATIEFDGICRKEEKRNPAVLMLDVAATISLVLAFNYEYPFITLLLWGIVMILRLVAELYTKEDSPLNSLAYSLMTQVYIALPLSLLGAISSLTQPSVLFAIFFFIWINDTGAFVVGSMIGKHRLFERISPKKSWEGFFGGWIFNIIAALIFHNYCSSFFDLRGSLTTWIVLATVVTLFATWGDLIESLIKRNLKIKDSGNLIPGHGGILDRIDSLLLVLPAVFIYFAISFFTTIMQAI